jgi:hypothetical protein
MVGAIISIVQIIFTSVAYVGNDPTPYVKDPLWVVAQLIGTVAVLLVVLGLPGVYARGADRAGVMGLIGLVLIAITGLMFPFFFGLASVLIFPWLVDKAPTLVSGSNAGPPAFFIFFITGTILQLIGGVLLAVVFLRGRWQPRWIAFLWAGSAIMAVVGFFLNGPGGPSNVLISLIGSASGLLLLAALTYMGYQTWSASAGLAPIQAEGPVST